MLTLADLGVLREVAVDADGAVTVTITPTYSGCPAMDAMHDDLLAALRAAGFERARVHVALRPAWSTDWISADGRRKLAEAGIAPPEPGAGAAAAGAGAAGAGAAGAGAAGAGAAGAGTRARGPVPLTLAPPPRRVPCPQCGCPDTELLSEFGATACRALRRCTACREPFEHVKEI